MSEAFPVVELEPDARIVFDTFDSSHRGWWAEETEESYHPNINEDAGKYGFTDVFWSEEFKEPAHAGSAASAKDNAKRWNERHTAGLYDYLIDAKVMFEWIDEEINRESHPSLRRTPFPMRSGQY